MTLFGLRRRVGKHGIGKGTNPEGPDAGQPEGPDARKREQQSLEPGGHLLAADRPNGPWDDSERSSEHSHVDLGAIRLPVAEAAEVQLNVLDDEVVAATITHGTSTLQLQAFAAPKSGSLWEETRHEIVTELHQGGTAVEEVDGPFGRELRAELTIHAEQDQQDQQGQQGQQGASGAVPQPARFVGVEGPRWLLRGVFTGPAANGSPQGQLLEEIFRGIVVVRGEEPMPPRERLTLRMPPQVQDATGQGEQDGAGAVPATDT